MEPYRLAPRQRPSVFAAIAMIVIGLVILLPSGLCTGALFLLPIAQNRSFSVVPLIIGGPFVFGGGLIVWKGISMFRVRTGYKKRPEEEF